MRTAPALLLSFGLAACSASGDPADGGFAAGIAGITTGSYDARIADREAEVAAAQTTQAELEAALARLTAELNALKSQVAAQQTALLTRGIELPPATQAETARVLAATPTESTAETQVQALAKAIADARAVSALLVDLGA